MARRFAATKLIEGDEDIISRLLLNQNELEMVEHSIVEMENEGKLDRNAAIASMRYDYIERCAPKPWSSAARAASICAACASTAC